MRNVEDNNDNVVYRSKARMPCLYRFVCCVSVLLLCYRVQMTLNLLAEKLDPSIDGKNSLDKSGLWRWPALACHWFRSYGSQRVQNTKEMVAPVDLIMRDGQLYTSLMKNEKKKLSTPKLLHTSNHSHKLKNYPNLNVII